MGNSPLFCASSPTVDTRKMFLDKYDDSNASVMLKIVVMGRVGVGKSAITSRFAHGAYPGQRYKPTTVANFAMKQFRFNNSTINAQIWDTSGADRLHHLPAQFFEGTDVAMLVYDVTDRTSFEDLNFFHERFVSLTRAWCVELCENGPMCKTHQRPFVSPFLSLCSVLCLSLSLSQARPRRAAAAHGCRREQVRHATRAVGCVATRGKRVVPGA